MGQSQDQSRLEQWEEREEHQRTGRSPPYGPPPCRRHDNRDQLANSCSIFYWCRRCTLDERGRPRGTSAPDTALAERACVPQE